MKKTFKHLKCHPKYSKYKSCINDQTVFKMRDVWNARHPDKKIKTKKRNQIEEQLKSYLSICNDQQCLLSNTIGKPLKIFAPKSPKSWNKNKSEWLDSLDIMRVMKQYEETYPNFKFLGPSPIDFDTKKQSTCVWPEICNLNIKSQLDKKHNKIGLIFNLDPHYKEGSHWTCMFIDLQNKYILYFDSSGESTPNEIKSFTERIQKQCEELNMKMKIYNNENHRHQYTDGECGMYSLYTIIKLLENKHTVNYFLKHKITDSKVNQYRSIFFNSDE